MIKKFQLLYVSALCCVILGGCDELDKLTQFNMNYETTYTVPSTAGIDLPLNLSTPDIATDSESKYENNNTSKDLVEEIFLKGLDLTITSPDDGDFNFLKSVTIYINAEGLSEEKIAWKEDIPNDNSINLSLETTDNDLKEFIKKDEFSLRVHTVTDEAIESDHDIKVESVFEVNAKVLGV